MLFVGGIGGPALQPSPDSQIARSPVMTQFEIAAADFG